MGRRKFWGFSCLSILLVFPLARSLTGCGRVSMQPPIQNGAGL